MRKWVGTLRIASLPAVIEKQLQERSKRILKRCGLPDSDIAQIVRELLDEVSFSYAGREHELEMDGPGRPLDGPANLLSVRVADILGTHGIRGNWLGLGDAGENGQIGPVAELEAVALTAFREASNN